MEWRPVRFHGTIDDTMRTVHPEDRDMVHGKIKRSIESGEQYEVEYRTVGQDGKVCWVEAKGRAFYDQHWSTPAYDRVSTNITARKKKPGGVFAISRNRGRFRGRHHDACLGRQGADLE
jgi:PAS domain-containing protein